MTAFDAQSKGNLGHYSRLPCIQGEKQRAICVHPDSAIEQVLVPEDLLPQTYTCLNRPGLHCESLPGNQPGRRRSRASTEPSTPEAPGDQDQSLNQPMPLDQLIDHAMLLAHRLAGFAAIYLIEDPAMMALIFC